MSRNDLIWDLTEIFASVDDPKISKTIDSLMAITSGLVSQYRGKIYIPGFTAQNLHDLLEQYEDLLARVREISAYSSDSFNADKSLPETKILWNKVPGFRSSIFEKLAFIELEMGKLVTENPQIINEKILSNYKHYLEKTKRNTPFRLSEIEEELILEKDQHGVIAMEQLRASWISSRKFKALIEGKEKIITRSETFPLFQHPDRETRISIFKGMYKMFEEEQEIYSSIVRNACGNWVKNVKRRQYDSQIHQSLIDNDTTQEIIDKLINTITNNIHIYQRFWRVKAKVLNLPKLEGFDIPAYISSDKKYSWNEIKKITIQIFKNFDKSFGDIITDMFERKHIDAGTREGKTDFVYCNHWYRGKSAFILTGFTGLPSDIRTLSHELGHAVHWYLASREQTFLNFIPATIIAEIASFFGELLLFDHLLSTTNSTTEKIALLTNQLNTPGQAIFHFTARMWCEQDLYDAIEQGEFLDGNTISKYWCAARDKIYGDSVEWSDDMKWEWVNFSYYCIPYYRFYNYQYAFSQLFVYALYQTYKTEREQFVPKFKKLLSAGGSVSPEELGTFVGMDISKSDFWNLGMNQYDSFLNELERLRGLSDG